MFSTVAVPRPCLLTPLAELCLTPIHPRWVMDLCCAIPMRFQLEAQFMPHRWWKTRVDPDRRAAIFLPFTIKIFLHSSYLFNHRVLSFRFRLAFKVEEHNIEFSCAAESEPQEPQRLSSFDRNKRFRRQLRRFVRPLLLN
jgi:hypothetical protein